MKWGKLAAGVALGLGMMAFGAGSANAVSIPFASFSAVTAPNVALATNGSGGVTLTATDGLGAPDATFTFVNVLFDLTGTPLPVSFNLTANSTANAASGFGMIGQGFSGSFSYVYEGANTTIGSTALTTGETLLSGAFTDAILSGPAGGGNSALFSLSAANNVNYSSPFLSFIANSIDNEFTIDINGMNPHLSITGNNITPFVGTAAGNFAASDETTPSCPPGQICVPEPITVSLFGAGLAGAAAFRRRRKVVAKV